MPRLTNVHAIGPVAKCSNARVNLHETIACHAQSKIVLVTPGGVRTHIPLDEWPEDEHIVWLCSWSLKTSRQDIILCDDVPLSFNEILASCDAVISKPGYGIVTETVCNQIPVLYAKRGDWPEETHLIKWWQENGVVAEIPKDALQSGEVIESLQLLWQQEFRKTVYPAGIRDACKIIAEYIEPKNRS